MTAIAGLWRFDGRPDAADACVRMLRAQQIYGPHDTAQWDDGFVALGRSLYRVLPEDRFDRQPLQGAGGRSVLVADVRLDNRDELAAALALAPERARQICDAALLLEALTRWDADCLERIIGDFAFAYWDGEKRRLTLARDPLGQRPLHIHRGAQSIAFASMPKGLHALGEFMRAPDEERIAEYVVLMPEYSTRSYFAEIERVEPGHIVTVTAEGSSSRRYWEPVRRFLSFKNPAEYDEGLRHHVDQATRARLRGAGPQVAAHLSGGLDSSIVTTTAARLLAPSGGRVVAITGVPRQGYERQELTGRLAFEDGPAALTAAMHPNIEHLVVDGGERALLDDLDRTFYLYDQPILNLSNGPWFYATYDAARARRLGVMLVGFQGNFTVSYDGAQVLPDLAARGRWLQWLRLYGALRQANGMSLKSALGQSLGRYIPGALWEWLNWLRAKREFSVTRYSAIGRERLDKLDLAARARAHGHDPSNRPRIDPFGTRLWALRRIDLGNFNKGTLAGWGVDTRDPTIDTRLVEYCLAVPPEQYVSGGVPRALARRAFTDRVPAAILNERRRGLQGADWVGRLRGAKAQVREEVDRLQHNAAAARILDVARLQKLTADWPESGWNSNEVITDYQLAMLRGVSVGHFLRRASGDNR
ncbi:MAG TPA: asparagine synthase-related protein [Pseudolabrys sp.]|nr:asparagine synthase-related protein [Pseudolabrys sp.]